MMSYELGIVVLRCRENMVMFDAKEYRRLRRVLKNSSRT